MNKYLIFDTETKNKNPESTDINIHDHIPFLVTYIVADEKLNEVDRGLFQFHETDKENKFINYIKECDTIVGANIKYDIHMLLNKNYNMNLFISKNYIDVQNLARLVIDGDKQGKDSEFHVALKKLAVRYLGVDTNAEEKELKSYLSKLVIEHKNKLKQFLIDKGLWFDVSNTKQTIILNNIYDNWYKVFHLYPQLVQARREFFNKYHRPTYEDCPNVFTYAMTDSELTHGLLKLWYPQAIKLNQGATLIRLSNATFPLIMMERTGLSLDLNKVLHDRELLVEEIKKTKIVNPFTGEEVSPDQNEKLRQIYEQETGLKLDKADKSIRSDIMEVSPTAQLVDYRKKLGKYLNTYVTRMLEKLTVDNGEYKVYTQYNMSGTVTGRLSSDFQQFPKEPLELKTGDIIDIRSWFIVPKGYKYIFYFDYSQLELRLQCAWTELVNGYPDQNMIRAFMPYNCIIKDDKYYLKESPDVEWTPTDLHGLTTKHAFPNINESSPDWGHYRKLGKACNFACNYGASAAKISETLHVDFDIAQKLVDGYKQTFKGVIDFSKWISRRVWSTNCFPNLFKRMYYSKNKHLLQNWLVQGSGADLLLIKLQETFEFLKTHPWWTYVITVHDEIDFACKDIPIEQLKKEVKELQALMKYSFTSVDVIADIEYTTTCWGEKKDYKEEELK